MVGSIVADASRHALPHKSRWKTATHAVLYTGPGEQALSHLISFVRIPALAIRQHIRPMYGTAKQAAEKRGPEGDGGFNPRIKPTESIGPLQAAEKGQMLNEKPEKRPSVAKALVDLIALAARLK
jgi:hypothetical protein